MDSNQYLVKHVKNICRTGYMHLYSISKIRSCLTQVATDTLVNIALITSRLDLCNAILYGLPNDVSTNQPATQVTRGDCSVSGRDFRLSRGDCKSIKWERL